MDNKLGKTIRILRQAQALRVSDLAEAAGVSVPFMSLVERGERQPSVDVLKRIAIGVRVPHGLLLAASTSDESLVARKQRGKALADSVDRLIELEEKLRKQLAKRE